NRNLLGYGFAHGSRLVHCGIRSTTSIHLKRSWSEAAHDELAVTISCTVQVTLLGRSQIVTRNYYPVRVRVSVQVHEHRFPKRRFDGEVSGRFVGRVPVSHCR